MSFNGTSSRRTVSHSSSMFRPRDRAAQAYWAIEILKKADANGVTVLVFPELCLDQAGTELLLRYFREHCSTLLLVVAGSFHVNRNGARFNECHAAIRHRAEPFIHRKFAEFFVRDDNDVERTEAISRTPRRLTIYASERWSFSLLICKDILEAGARFVLEQVGVCSIFVPAFSPKMAAFTGFVNGLSQSNQAVVVVANNPSEPSTVAGLFAVPIEGEALRRAIHSGNTEIPLLHSFDPVAQTLDTVRVRPRA